MGAAGVGGGGERERGVKAGTGSRGRLREHRSGAVRIVVEMNGKEVAHPVPNLWLTCTKMNGRTYGGETVSLFFATSLERAEPIQCRFWRLHLFWNRVCLG